MTKQVDAVCQLVGDEEAAVFISMIEIVGTLSLESADLTFGSLGEQSYIVVSPTAGSHAVITIPFAGMTLVS